MVERQERYYGGAAVAQFWRSAARIALARCEPPQANKRQHGEDAMKRLTVMTLLVLFGISSAKAAVNCGPVQRIAAASALDGTALSAAGRLSLSSVVDLA